MSDLRPHRFTGVLCSVDDCFDEAAAMGRATIEVDPLARASRADSRAAFALPLCLRHAHLLRMDNTLVEFDSGLEPLAYIARRTAEGKTSREIKRCLARYVARDLYRLLEKGAPAA